jgi:hypothetical protein
LSAVPGGSPANQKKSRNACRVPFAVRSTRPALQRGNRLGCNQGTQPRLSTERTGSLPRCSAKGVICKFLTMRSSPKAQSKVGDALIHREAAVNWLVLHRMRFITGARGIFLFIQSLLKSPLAVGALVPSSPQLSRLIASQVGCGSSHVLEVGAGTGSITDALLSLGVPANRLFVI